MDYFFQQGDDETLVVGFHGMGNNEYQLLTIIAQLYPTASILTYLGPLGNKSARRFFSPLENGKVDRAAFTASASEFLENDWPKFADRFKKVIFIGYSNGANFILGLLEQQPELAEKIILLHPSFLNFEFQQGANTEIWLTTGSMDSESLPGDVLKLQQQLQKTFPNTQLILVDGMHGITDDEIEKLKKNI